MLLKNLIRLCYAGFTTQQLYRLFKKPLDVLTNDITQTLHQRITYENHPLFHTKLQKFNALNASQILYQLWQAHITPITILNDQYPRLLKEIYQPPLILFCKGNLSLLNAASYKLAIVGARDFTQYGDEAVRYLLQKMKRASIIVVSGLAKGTDALAHYNALKNEMPTIGVLGFGHQYHYPSETKPLRHTLETNQLGLTISEYPPMTPPAKFRFPERNRLISGISHGVLVTEAKERSGALITLDQALEQNRNVYVLPGDMFNKHTKGNMMRVKEGAEIVLSAEDILKDMNTSIR
ncbi:DNA-processing protein DprA [Staphylococcus hyicus]|uniref:DNA-processing protein DprA n=1 Tax=Staphylococcus hyicus TaxID=1284 RepID=UPI00057CBA07|nr:DNA-processing protein DprA [Staphylococcus hyicus]AJC96369.1 putative DNA processing factor DprA(SMF) [Staphylococcus hyicus]MCQ9290554.1 DNA-processing protein DprA [Staphylococcus hyicus]MCQ9305796.1 DNA-processing protein DprA [Staphylococcus hyicus]MCQ9308208.1 DNA-processing protein DprA [Staphylococcus hyicus]MCQ9310630.1 DNA-processing protein DprA [Staphylococcus hyicus]